MKAFVQNIFLEMLNQNAVLSQSTEAEIQKEARKAATQAVLAATAQKEEEVQIETDEDDEAAAAPLLPPSAPLLPPSAPLLPPSSPPEGSSACG